MRPINKELTHKKMFPQKSDSKDQAVQTHRPKKMMHKSEIDQALDLNTQEITQKKSKKKLKIALIISLLILLLVILGALSYTYWFYSTFAQAAGFSQQELYSTIKSGLNHTPTQENGHTTFLVLGVDQILNQKDSSILTDTIIVAVLNNHTQQITLLPIPRDLWIDTLKTKINALYYYGELEESTTGIEFATDVISELLDLPIHYTFVINLQTLELVINTIGGITIDVPSKFTDDKFPKSDVDITKVTDPDLLYETITFSEGPTHMNGVTALKYIRSRSSTDLTQGTDQARSDRQLSLINSILEKIATREVLTDPHLLGNLFKIYRDNITTNMTNEELIALAKLNFKQPPVLNVLTLPIQNGQSTGIIINPPVAKYKQWVYEPIDPSWKELQEFISSQLDYSSN